MSQAKSPMALLVDAIDKNDAKQVEALLRKYPNQRNIFTPFCGGTWLHYAAGEGRDAVVEYLLASGMDINVQDQWDGTSALCSAAQQNRTKTAQFLIENGIALDIGAPVRNPLFASVVGQSPECVRVILGAGIDAKVRYNSKTMDNMDAVAFALMRGERECAEIIAEWNANGDSAAAAKALAEADEIAERNARSKGHE